MADGVDHQAAPGEPWGIVDDAMREAKVITPTLGQLGQRRQRAQHTPLAGRLDAYATRRDFDSVTLVVAERRILRGGSRYDIEPHPSLCRISPRRVTQDCRQPTFETRHCRRQPRGRRAMRVKAGRQRMSAAGYHLPWQGHQAHPRTTRFRFRYKLRQSSPKDASRSATSLRNTASASSPNARPSASA